MNKQFKTHHIGLVILLASLCSFTFGSHTGQAQEKVYKISEKSPQPAGGLKAFFEYAEENLKRPKKAITDGVSGNVFVRFIVEKDGKLSNIEVIKGLGAGCDEAVVELLQNAPNWKPGFQHGKAVRVFKTLAIRVD